jgi:transcriptional regulator with XRE-family HTH domain
MTCYSRVLTTTNSELATRLICARLKAGVTQQTLAASIGCHRSAIRHYEAGRRVPDVLAFLRIASALNTPAAALLDGLCQGGSK